jgi:hypothetical protein
MMSRLWGWRSSRYVFSVGVRSITPENSSIEKKLCASSANSDPR